MREDAAMTLPTERRFAGVLAINQGRVILVREEHPHWGGAFWNIPSGMVEADETPAEGAAREFAEEAGVDVAPAHLQMLSTSSVQIGSNVVFAWNFKVAVENEALAMNDPDNLVQEARWFAISQAAMLLADLPYRPTSEPVLAALVGRDRRRMHWSYAAPEPCHQGPARLLTSHALRTRCKNILICRRSRASLCREGGRRRLLR